MKAKVCLSIIFLSVFVVGLLASEQIPILVSPSSEVGIAVVGEVCPTFSWTAVEGAVAYRVEVFPAWEKQSLAYEIVTGQVNPVLIKEIPGAATSWTPSADECLRNEGIYIWFVQARDEYGTGKWSQGRRFKIEAGAGFAAIEEVVSDTLEEHGVEKKIIEDVIGNIKQARDVTIAGSANPLPISVLGHESDTNTWYGLDAGASITTGYYNSLFGQYAGNSLTSGSENTFIGRSAGLSNTIGSENTFVGVSAGWWNQGSFNTFIGNASGIKNTTGNNNTFIGYVSGYENTTGYGNTFVGRESGYGNTTGYSNAFFGLESGNSNTTGYANTFIGRFAGHDNTEGIRNVFLGRGAGNTNTTGDNNTFLGDRAGYSNISGDGNVFIGYNAGYNETDSNRLYIDNSDTSKPLIWGNFNTDTVAFMGTVGIGTKVPAFPMEMKKTGTNASIVVDRTDGATNYINATDTSGNFGTVTNHVLRLVVNSLWQMRIHTDGSMDMRNGASCTTGGVWTNASSRDLKENINNLTAEKALDTLESLQPVTYNYKADKEDDHVGFIAEDVPDLVASKDRKGMSPMDVVAVLTKVLQEQQKVNEELRAEIAELRAKLNQDR